MTESPWSRDTERRRAAPPAGRLIEIVTVLLLALATVGSAWSAFQVSRWNGVETDEARDSAAFRIDASREYSLATQIVAYDAAAVSQFGQAIASGNEELEAFLRQTIIRTGFEPILAQWREEVDAGREPTNLLENRDYLEGLFAESDALDAEALAATQRSEEAGDHADDYIRLTLFFASALFFAGITASFRTRVPKVALLAAAAATLAVAGALLIDYPVA